MQIARSRRIVLTSRFHPIARAAHGQTRLIAVLGCWALALLVACATSDESKLEEVRELQAAGDMEKSIPILIDLIESGARDGEILYRYGRALSLSGHPERSIWALDAAREDPEWFVNASQQLALDAQTWGNLEFAMEVFKRLHEEAPEAMEDDPYALILEARVLLETQTHFEEALDLIDSILERFPEEDSAVRLKAAALLGLKRPDEAYEVIRSAGLGPEAKASDDPLAAGAGESDASAEADGDEAAEGEEGDAGDPELYAEVEDAQREAYWCMIRTSFKREAGEIEEASAIIDECLARFPTSSGLLGEAVEHYSGLGRTDRVLEILETAYSKDPANPQIRNAYAKYLSALGRIDEMEKLLRKSIADAVAAGRGESTEVASHWIDLAGFLLENDRVGEALVAFDAVNKIVGENATPELLLREAEAMIRAKEYGEALKMADKTPVEVHGHMIRGRVAFEQGDFQKAFDELEQAAVLWPDNAPIRYYRARAAEGLGRIDLAVEEYRQAIRSDADLDAARERLARLHLGEGNAREAANILAFVNPKKPSTPSTAMRILAVEADARRDVEPDLNILPDREYPAARVRLEAIRSLSRGLTARHGQQAAARVLAEFEKSAIPEIRGAFARERVEILMAEGRLDDAVKVARASFKARPADLDSSVALARALVRQGTSLDEAGKLLDAILAAQPDELDALAASGELAAQRKDLAAADAIWDRVLALAPDRWDVLRPRVEHLVAAGKRDEAIARLESFVDRDSPYDGRGSLELARLLPEGEANRARRIELARRSIRFGAGQPAVDLLVSLDPAAATEFAPPPTSAETAPAATGDPARDSDGPTKAESKPADGAGPEKRDAA